jgi:tetratricopeptide (TPR) repeat protein
VDYVLEGSIRWSRSADGSKVRITPQLIRVSDDTQIWSDNYDRIINDVFQVQSEIAQNVITGLGITLQKPQQAKLTAAPTQNVEAYQAYLRGKELEHFPSYDEELMQKVIQYYERAVELDPNFVAAYCALSSANLDLFHEGYDPSPNRLEVAKKNIDKATQLNPDSPEVRIALGHYYYYGFREYERALTELNAASGAAPSNIEAMTTIAYIERRQGKFEDSVRHLKKVLELDPRNAEVMMELGFILIRMRRYEEAQQYADRALGLVPDQVYGYLLSTSCQINSKGDVKKARSILEKMPQKELSFYTNFWLQQEIRERRFQEALDRLDNSHVELFQEDAIYLPSSLLRADILRYMKKEDLARASYEEARVLLEQKAREWPDNSPVHSALGRAYAGLGRKEDAIREGKRAVELLPISKDALMGPGPISNLADIYCMLGEYDLALDQMEILLSVPSWFSVPVLQLDPQYDELRSLPRYKQLMTKYSQK